MTQLTKLGFCYLGIFLVQKVQMEKQNLLKKIGKVVKSLDPSYTKLHKLIAQVSMCPAG